VWRLWVGLGAGVWMLTILASAAMNFLSGYGFGRTPHEAIVLAVIGVAADCWMAIGPIFIAALWRSRRLAACALAAMVWIACFLFAITAAIGFAAHNRNAQTAVRETLNASLVDATRVAVDLERRRSVIVSARSSSEVEAAVTTALAQPVPGRGTVAAVSGHCMRDHPRTRESCARIASLREELARTQEGERLDKEIEAQRSRVQSLRERGATRDADPQARLIARQTLGHVTLANVGSGLVLLLVLMIELISAFAPVVISEFAREARGQISQPEKGSNSIGRSYVTGALVENSTPDHVMEYLAERIEPVSGGVVRDRDLYSDYHEWCRLREHVAFPRSSFVQEMDRICLKELGSFARRVGRSYHGFLLVNAVHCPH
jgi:hypothetical protein